MGFPPNKAEAVALHMVEGKPYTLKEDRLSVPQVASTACFDMCECCILGSGSRACAS